MNAELINALSNSFTNILPSYYQSSDYLPINLSNTNTELQGVDVASSSAMERYIEGYLKRNKAKVAYGGYLEKRAIYQRSEHFNQNDPDTERNIHLGLDLWCPAGTPIIAPLSGTVHSFKNNDNYGDYGPTIIVEHTVGDIKLYTLYGHLSLASIQGLEKQKNVVKGQQIAELGDASVNGDYAPHLHFQIILDMQGNEGDYPGVCSKRDLSFYQKNCPDPNLILNLG
ncbi:peptidoglycan DD-metalloendopeptidase family protein [Aquimarina brevivitae]|uniref:Peptidase M23-like protein n=1 Tax=Aquimarina brevivitae TaxID=323412 RepID=A0A4Q7PMM2_9FLAO|nr:peptidoglycan DD-metalloendopeptidase family protein [Aquimarina brevivitae]RZT00273.1 peptidase M23-like protein [Aquimarina brevivitae]